MSNIQTKSERLNATFSALADPTRRAILGRLSTGEASVTDLAKPLDMTMPAVTKHLKVLQKAGLIRRERRAQWRPCYLVAEPLKEASDWVEKYRQFWEESFERLDEILKELQISEPSESFSERRKRTAASGRVSENKTIRRKTKWQTKQK